jgi:hypothetical protein
MECESKSSGDFRSPTTKYVDLLFDQAAAVYGDPFVLQKLQKSEESVRPTATTIAIPFSMTDAEGRGCDVDVVM